MLLLQKHPVYLLGEGIGFMVIHGGRYLSSGYSYDSNSFSHDMELWRSLEKREVRKR